MPQVIIPAKTKKWVQPNEGDILGNVWATLGIDFKANRGEVGISNRLNIVIDSSDDADLGYVSAFLRTSADTTDRWWAICGSVFFKSTNSNPGSAWAQDGIANSPTDLVYGSSDAVDFEGAMIVSSSNDLHRLSAGTWNRTWWTDAGDLNQTAFTSSVPHPLDVFNRLLLIGDDQFLHTVDRNNSVMYKRLTLPNGYRIRFIKPSSDRVWIGANSTKGERAAIFEWDGYSDTFLKMHLLEGTVVFAAAVKNDLVHAILNTGHLVKGYTGGTFVELPNGKFPVASTNFLQNSSTFSPADWDDGVTGNFVVHWNGMDVVDGLVHILASGAIAQVKTNIFPNMPSGIWCYDPDVGLYHRFTLTLNKGVTEAEYGFVIFSSSGALANTGSKVNGQVLAGVGYYTDSGSTERKGIFVPNKDYIAQGQLVTTKIGTANIADMWEKVWLKFRNPQNDTNNRIVVKVRNADVDDIALPILSAITWTSTTTFTSTNSAVSNVAVGDHVEILCGANTGYSALITVISENAGTYTFTIDTTFSSSSGSSQCRFWDWKSVGTISSTGLNFKSYPLSSQSIKSQWIQLRLELRGRFNWPRVNEITVKTNNAISADD